MRNYSSVGVQVADILFPHENINLQTWATIACDQFTSQPEYWRKVAELVGDAPSTFNLILPEVYLGKPEEVARIEVTQQAMSQYLEGNLFDVHTGIVYVERTSLGKTRRGLVLALDLEKYNFSPGSQSLIRATEGTILERLPPRMRIREKAVLELPHILVLIDDPERTVIEPISQQTTGLKPLYDFELMQGSGHLCGALINNLELENQIIHALERLASPQVFYPKYGVDQSKGILLFAVGDGNHSLATAKAIWDKVKPSVGMNHPARFALVEVENVHDQGLTFEPIHRVLFGLNQPVGLDLKHHFGDSFEQITFQTAQEMVTAVKNSAASLQTVGLITPQDYSILRFKNPTSNLPVGTLQAFLDQWLKDGGASHIDYVHGEAALLSLSRQEANCGFYLPSMDKADLFKTVILDGVLPRKTFSMGEAIEKRFYLEARKIV